MRVVHLIIEDGEYEQEDNITNGEIEHYLNNEFGQSFKVN